MDTVASFGVVNDGNGWIIYPVKDEVQNNEIRTAIWQVISG
ncbi:MAG: hypothetical protein WDM71_06025 [Ferruginibacter sp.]